jgi:hypothetical protein
MAYQDPDGGVDSEHASSVEPTSPDRSLESSFSSLEFGEVERGDAAEILVEHICGLYYALNELPSLTPRPNVNQLFSDLVSTCLEEDNEKLSKHVLGDARIVKLVPHLRQLCSAGESELESYWAQRMSDICAEQQQTLKCRSLCLLYLTQIFVMLTHFLSQRGARRLSLLHQL